MVAALAAFSCSKKEAGYTITVNTGNLQEIKSLILTNTRFNDPETPFSDTVAVVNNKAVFSGSIEDFEEFYLMGVIEGSVPKLITDIYLENANYTVNVKHNKDRYDADILSNGAVQTQIDSLKKLTKAVYANIDMDALMQEYSTADKAKQDSLGYILFQLSEKAEKIRDEFFENNPLSPVALIDAASDIRYMGLEPAREAVNKFAAVPEYASNKLLKKMQQELEKKEALAPGKQAPDFTLNNPEGNPVKFSDVYPKNKVTMIDFWASWCGPCRQFNPTLTKIYDKYKKKGFGIIGVSLDKDHDKWTKAIKADKLNWLHVSDLAYWDSQAGRLYNISSIPQSYFVDAEGKILLASPSEEQIESFLAEYLK